MEVPMMEEDVQVVAKPHRRIFTTEYKRRIAALEREVARLTAREERTRLSALLRLTKSIIKGYRLREDLSRCWDYRYTTWAEAHLRQWFWRASHNRLGPFQQLAQMLRTHLDGVLAWTRIRITNDTLESMNN